MFYQV